MNFIQTRGCDVNKKESVSFSEAILSPIASFGGLYVPYKCSWCLAADDGQGIGWE